MNWYAEDKKIIELVDYSKEKFDIELPLAKEILKLSRFLFDLVMFFNRKTDSVNVELERPKKARLKWFHIYGNGGRTETLEVPEDAVWLIKDNCLEILNQKCEELADLCGWYKKHPKDRKEE